MCELRWFRDKGRGQEAADVLGAEQTMDGSWPVATLKCERRSTADMRWWQLLVHFDVNAMTYI